MMPFFKKKQKSKEDYYLASQWVLMGRKLKRHKLARVSMLILGILYFAALFGQFIAPYGLEEFDGLYRNSAPTKIYWIHEGEYVGPYVCKLQKTIDKTDFSVTITEDITEYYPIELFVHGSEYKFLGLFETDIHLFGVGEGSKGGTGATTAAAARNALGLGNTTGAVPIANGGTGATTAANARTNLGITLANLGAAASGHSHALTAATITGTLPISKGGTGATTAAAALQALGIQYSTSTPAVVNGGIWLKPV